MADKHPQSTLQEFALITSSTIEIAIQELASNKPELCLETLSALHNLLKELTSDVGSKIYKPATL